MLGYIIEAAGALGCGVVGATLLDRLPTDPESLLLLVFSALLPNKLGVRTGTQAGSLYAPILLGHYSYWTQWPEMTAWSPAFLKLAISALSHERLVCGVIGGLCGAFAFLSVGKRRRLLGNIAAAVGGGLSVTVLAALFFFANAVMMTQGHPSRFLWLLQGVSLGAMLAVLAGTAFGLGQRASEKVGDVFRRIPSR